MVKESQQAPSHSLEKVTRHSIFIGVSPDIPVFMSKSFRVIPYPSYSAFCSLLMIGIERMKYFILFTLEQANSNFLRYIISLYFTLKTKLH